MEIVNPIRILYCWYCWLCNECIIEVCPFQCVACLTCILHWGAVPFGRCPRVILQRCIAQKMPIGQSVYLHRYMTQILHGGIKIRWSPSVAPRSMQRNTPIGRVSVVDPRGRRLKEDQQEREIDGLSCTTWLLGIDSDATDLEQVMCWLERIHNHHLWNLVNMSDLTSSI